MEQTNNGSGTPVTGDAFNAEPAFDVEKLRAMALDAVRNADVYVKQARELVARHPVYAVAGAAAVGFLFAKLVARKG